MPATQASIFVSYAHEDRALAHALARALEAEGARVWVDQGELLIGDSLIERISEAIAEFDFVAALVSAASVESAWCRKEISLAMTKQVQRGGRGVVVLPLRVGDVAMPPALTDVLWEQLTPDDVTGCARRVVRDAAGHLRKASSLPAELPAPGFLRTSRGWGTEASGADDAPVKLIGVESDAIGRPRNDGTAGSGLYRIPLILNRVPPAMWSGAFADAWDQPPAWTSMHRPGIASVQGSRIVLDGTSIEELERYHLKTLKLVIGQLNEAMKAHGQRERSRIEVEKTARTEQDRRISEVVERLQFDDD